MPLGSRVQALEQAPTGREFRSRLDILVNDDVLTTEAFMETVEGDYQAALEKCQEGKFSADLRALYLMPYREQVPWGLFPNWARPNDPVEGPHEGGAI